MEKELNMAKQFSKKFNTLGELAEIIKSLPKEVQNQKVLFGDVMGDKERDAYPVDEIGTIKDACYIATWDENKLPRGSVMLF